MIGICKLPEQKAPEAAAGTPRADVSALSAMLAAKWKSGSGAEAAAEAPKAGQIRSFKIVSLDPGQKKIELELV